MFSEETLYAEVCLKTLGDAIHDLYKDNIEALPYEDLYSLTRLRLTGEHGERGCTEGI
uniref:Uncharacterized protein n=1 Tax=Helianthus annuus TaxID=4232 RepID=A0A251UCF9_HELAN